MGKLRHAVSEIHQNFFSLKWWRNRVFVPHVVGRATRLHPSYPGYDEAIKVTEEDWDNLLVLDACRADAFERVADLDRFDDYRSVVSLGSHSSEWTRRNFAGQEFGDIVYVSANPHTSKLAGDSFHTLVEMWDREFDDISGTVPPDTMGEAAREALDQYPNKRLIVHFMQPHGPFIGSDVPEEEFIERYWEAYDQNLEFALASVYELLDELPGRTVVSADHGQIAPGPVTSLFGVNGHKARLRHPGVVTVPWAIKDGDRRRIVTGKTSETTSDGIDNRLRDLGYKI